MKSNPQAAGAARSSRTELNSAQNCVHSLSASALSQVPAWRGAATVPRVPTTPRAPAGPDRCAVVPPPPATPAQEPCFQAWLRLGPAALQAFQLTLVGTKRTENPTYVFLNEPRISYRFLGKHNSLEVLQVHFKSSSQNTSLPIQGDA